MVKFSSASRADLKRTLQRSYVKGYRTGSAAMRYRWFLRREKISHEMSAAPRNDAAPVLRMLLEGIVLERIDLKSNKISDTNLYSPVG